MPDYPLYSAVLAKLEIGLNTYYLNEEDGWQPDLDDIKKKLRADARNVLINPNNPTGSVYTRKTLEHIAELARRHKLIVFADEITTSCLWTMTRMMHGRGRARCAGHYFRRTVQELPRPGWRIGWGIAAAKLPSSNRISKA